MGETLTAMGRNGDIVIDNDTVYLHTEEDSARVPVDRIERIDIQPAGLFRSGRAALIVDGIPVHPEITFGRRQAQTFDGLRALAQ